MSRTRNPGNNHFSPSRARALSVFTHSPSHSHLSHPALVAASCVQGTEYGGVISFEGNVLITDSLFSECASCSQVHTISHTHAHTSHTLHSSSLTHTHNTTDSLSHFFCSVSLARARSLCVHSLTPLSPLSPLTPLSHPHSHFSLSHTQGAPCLRLAGSTVRPSHRSPHLFA